MQISNCYKRFLVVPYRIHVMAISQMFSTCVWQLHCKKFEPHPAMFSRCFWQFPEPWKLQDFRLENPQGKGADYIRKAHSAQTMFGFQQGTNISLQNILLSGPFTLGHHLLHDHSYDLPMISTFRVLVFLIVHNQDCLVVSQPNGLSRSHVIKTEDLLRIEGR
jgi:hypothetical protein